VPYQEIEIPILGADNKYLPTVVGHPSSGVDVAAVHVTKEVLNFKIAGFRLTYDMFATRELLTSNNITVGDEVFLLGYPNAIYDERNSFPILRIGTIATAPAYGFAFNSRLRTKYGLPSKIDGFLVDANVYPGSSGSIVILKQQAATIGKDGVPMLGGGKTIPYLLGIVSGSIPIEDQALGSKGRMGLGIVYSADIVRETIELFPALRAKP
jgi:hypothetical protein